MKRTRQPNNEESSSATSVSAPPSPPRHISTRAPVIRGRHTGYTWATVKAQAEIIIEAFPGPVSERHWEVVVREAVARGRLAGVVGRNSFKRTIRHYAVCPSVPVETRSDARRVRDLVLCQGTKDLANVSCAHCRPNEDPHGLTVLADAALWLQARH
jgi:hypothetical protein